jgi:pimeloyl-ACP methyl ester carboxylesterase
MPEAKYITVSDLKTRYWATGEEGTAVVLIHGLGGSADIWMHNVQALASQHRVYVPDLAGFGGSDQPGPSFSPFDYARFLDDFMSLLHIESPSLVGHSLGGGIALHYAISFPEKVNKLVLVDSAGLGKGIIWTLRLMSLPLLGELCSYPTRKGVELFFKFAVRNRALITKDFVELYYHFFSRPGFQNFLLRMVRMIVTVRGARERILKPIVDNLEKVKQPVLIIWGGKDRVLPLKHAYFAKRKLPDATLEIIEECGHLSFFERPDVFNRLVLNFLGREQARPLALKS